MAIDDDYASGSVLDLATTVLLDHAMDEAAEALEARCAKTCGHRLAPTAEPHEERWQPPIEAIRSASGLVASERNKWEHSQSIDGQKTFEHWQAVYAALAGFLLAHDVRIDTAPASPEIVHESRRI